jgi:hypothetical protein
MSRARGGAGDRESYPSFWQDLGKSSAASLNCADDQLYKYQVDRYVT